MQKFPRRSFRDMPEAHGEHDDAEGDLEKLERKSGSNSLEMVSLVPRWKGETTQKFPRRLFRDMPEAYGEPDDAREVLEKDGRKSGDSSRKMVFFVPMCKGKTMQEFPRRPFCRVEEVQCEPNEVDKELEVMWLKTLFRSKARPVH